jgi:DNA replication initiation complex subunit (GINS family)
MAKEEKNEEKKLIIDEDWKQQAQKEKELLAAQEKAEEKAEEKKAQREEIRRGPLPKGDFAGLLSMLVTQALFSLGLLAVEGQEKKEPDLELAKYNIDILETIEEKTKGNLTEEEKKVLENMLEQVRMAYVKVAG